MNGLVAITGVGFSALGRDTGMSEGHLAVTACRAALADSGLQVEQIDGLAMFPYRSSPPSPFAGPGLPFVQRSLGIRQLRWWRSTTADDGQLGVAITAIDALIAGRCTHVLCYRAHLRQQRRYLGGGSDPTQAYDEDEHTVPYGGGSGAARGALWAARYMARYSVTQEQLGSINVNGRAYAANNPLAVWQEPTTIEDYLDSRWICPPLKVLDCDYPIDGATAFILSRSDAASVTRKPVYIESAGSGPGPHTGWLQWEEKSEMAARYAGAEMWSHTRLRPSDVDDAEVYDGFSFFTPMWLEGLGLLDAGKGAAWMAAGGGRPGSELAVNTDGGQLGVGRLHGFGKVVQAVRQLRGEAPNQLADPEVAVASAGGGPGCACVLLTREPAA